MRPLTCPSGIFASSIRGGLTVCASVRRRDLAAISLRLRFQYQARAGVFVNCNCVILDGCEVSIGDKTQIGPAVQILAADHPRDAAQRAAGLEFGRPIRIGCNVWIGGGAIILPGVSIGDDALIGAGSVVTRDIPAGAVALGNPARVQTVSRAL